jgi:hypothetical protein
MHCIEQASIFILKFEIRLFILSFVFPTAVTSMITIQ